MHERWCLLTLLGPMRKLDDQNDRQTMDIEAAFLIYAGLYRLGVIAAGTCSLVLGARLLMARRGSERVDTSLAVEAGGQKLSMTTTASGTVFVCFGFLIIAVMVVRGEPELDRTSSSANGSEPRTETTILRGPARHSIGAKIGEAIVLAETGQETAATARFEEALGVLSLAANEVAVAYYQELRDEEALRLAELAVALSPRDAANRDTLNRVLARMKDR